MMQFKPETKPDPATFERSDEQGLLGFGGGQHLAAVSIHQHRSELHSTFNWRAKSLIQN